MIRQDRVNYDEVAPTYDRRYEGGGPQELSATLRDLVSEFHSPAVLEVGCGTGHWLGELQDMCHMLVGLDLSRGMLMQARTRAGRAHLLQGRAEKLPLENSLFDLMICVNTIHHFNNPFQFVNEAYRVLRVNGLLIVVAMAPHDDQDRWYLYDYFPGTRTADLQRYPKVDDLRRWMSAAGFQSIATDIAVRKSYIWSGSEVFQDPILSRHGTSQLSLLTQHDFDMGMRRIRAAVEEAEANGTVVVFSVDLRLFQTTARKK